jgi:hypothetical protein
MAPKRKTDNNVTSSNRRSKNFTDLQTKIQIIEQSEQGARTSDITKKFNLPWSTVDSILKNKDRYKTAAKSVPGNVKLLKSREDIFIQMEKHLVTWIHEKGKCGDCVSSAVIREKAKKLFEKLKEKNPECKSEFVASMGWFNRFLNRTGLKCVLMRGEVTSADAETGSKFGLRTSEEAEDLLKSHNESLTDYDSLETEDHRVSEGSEVDESTDIPQKDLTAADLKQLFTYIDSIKTITDKDPLQDRAFKCYSAIQSACLPYRTKLKEIETKTKQTRFGRAVEPQRVSSPVASTRTLSQSRSSSSDFLQISGEDDLPLSLWISTLVQSSNVFCPWEKRLCFIKNKLPCFMVFKLMNE